MSLGGISGAGLDEYLREAEARARVFSGAWTGTSGSLAADVVRLIRHIREQSMPDTNRAEEVLHEAVATVRQRRGTYGPPREHFSRTVAAVNAIFAHKLREPLTEADWAQVMILDKLARHQGASKSSDTPLDICGYGACLAECESGG